MCGGFWAWRDRAGDLEVCFTGKGPETTAAETLSRVEPTSPPVAWAKQVHSARVLNAVPGICGEGDALVSRERGLAVSVLTADCVPVLLGGSAAIAAVHAGWRGIASGVVPAAVERMGESPRALRAWIGPAIGPCCYEVGEDVASAIAMASDSSAVRPREGGRPHLDLHQAVALQLRAAGVEAVQYFDLCTRCYPEKLWSYRREGAGTGRNRAYIWRRRLSEEV